MEGKYKVESIRMLNPSAFIIRMERNGMHFRAGQNISVALNGDNERRDYSVYSAEDDDFLEILVKEVQNGLVSRRLRKLNPGDRLSVEGPFGFFSPRPEETGNRRYLFVASGTGIAPFHSIVLSNPGMEYHLVHGVRYGNEACDRSDFEQERYVLCTSRDDSGDYSGRVTSYLEQHPVLPGTLCYLCGNVNMIYDAYDILKKQGVPAKNLHAEAYF